MKEMAFFRRYLLVGSLLVLGTGAGFLLYAFYGPNIFPDAPEKFFYVSRGEPFPSIVDSLEAHGIIRSRALFDIVARVFGGTNRIQVGKYLFRSGISNAEIFQDLRSGHGSMLVTVAIPEGLMARQQARLLARQLGIDSVRYMDLVRDESFVHSLGIESSSLEGYLFPDSYNFYWDPDEKEVIRRLVDQFKIFYTDSLRDRATQAGMTTNQVLTLASIVEGEAVLDQERSIIAGVYFNRLRRGMRLEADPTIEYFIENGPRRVYYSDLKIGSPYNTYLNKGLPPGPVNNPGKLSILAVLYPAHHQYLFFVANGRGGHWFSRTFNEHKRNIRMYRRHRSREHASTLESPH